MGLTHCIGNLWRFHRFQNREVLSHFQQWIWSFTQWVSCQKPSRSLAKGSRKLLSIALVSFLQAWKWWIQLWRGRNLPMHRWRRTLRSISCMDPLAEGCRSLRCSPSRIAFGTTSCHHQVEELACSWIRNRQWTWPLSIGPKTICSLRTWHQPSTGPFWRNQFFRGGRNM